MKTATRETCFVSAISLVHFLPSLGILSSSRLEKKKKLVHSLNFCSGENALFFLFLRVAESFWLLIIRVEQTKVKVTDDDDGRRILVKMHHINKRACFSWRDQVHFASLFCGINITFSFLVALVHCILNPRASSARNAYNNRKAGTWYKRVRSDALESSPGQGGTKARAHRSISNSAIKQKLKASRQKG